MKHHQIRMIFARLTGLMPTSTLRVFLYRALFGYRIHRSQLGRHTIIVVAHAELTGCRIGSNNRFVGPMRVTIGDGARIGDDNLFDCGWWTAGKQFATAGYDRQLQIGARTLITSAHHFDVVGSFVLGPHSWIAGRGSQFWTHGAGAADRNITIGAHCYIGSAVRFAPGASVGSNCIVGLGSIVTKKFVADHAVIAGQPARITRENYDWKTKQAVSKEA